jgi:hypothetical protein
MSSEEIVTLPVLQAILSSRPAAYMASHLIPVCCVCGLIPDQKGSLPSRMSRVRPGSSRRTHNVHSTDLLFMHSYCPDCLLLAQTE